MVSPVDSTAKSFTPRSMPIDSPVLAAGSGSSVSTAKVTYQRPSGSRETTTIVGLIVAGSMSGQDHTNSSGVDCFANVNVPPRMVKALRV